MRKRAEQDGGGPAIVLGVTDSISLGFLKGFPEYLASNGWRVHIVSAPGPSLSEYPSDETISPHAIKMARNPHVLSDLKSLNSWVRLLREIRPDVVMVGTPKASMLSMVAAAITQVPTRIYHLYGLRLETTTGLLRFILLTLERLTSWCATSVISVSPSLSHAAMQAGIVGAAKLRMIGRGSASGIDTSYFDRSAVAQEDIDRLRTRFALDRHDFVVGYVGRIHPDKGLEYLMAALDEMPQNPRPHKLLVVGGGDHSRYDPFQQSSFPVHLVGGVSDPRPYYAVMDVLCLPTLREGLPNVPIEAAAMGIPVITTTATGAIDSVSDGITGLTVPPANAIVIRHALDYIRAHPIAAAEMGSRGRAWVTEHFERRQVWDNYEQYLRQAVRANRTSPPHLGNHERQCRDNYRHRLQLRALSPTVHSERNQPNVADCGNLADRRRLHRQQSRNL